jgi:transcriptional antiterminator RfaH
MTTVIGPRWFVVRTQPRAEGKAHAHPGRQGFETYLPRYLKKRRHARRVDTVPAALFPRYFFIAIDVATQRWRAISSTISVSQLVCNGEEPAVVPPHVIESLRALEDERGFFQLKTRPQFKVGQKIRIEDDRRRASHRASRSFQSQGSRRSRPRLRRGGLAAASFQSGTTGRVIDSPELR